MTSDSLKKLFENNRRWINHHVIDDPDYFLRMSKEQKPGYLWIGCSDSRVPANEIVGLEPGELFVHRNVANLFIHTDLNCLSVLQYAVEVLQIEHIIVCGHYGCGGVKAAMENKQFGIIDNWLRNIRDIHALARDQLQAIEDPVKRCDRLVELSVLQQVRNISHTTIVQNAWSRGQPLSVHGWVYEMASGQLQGLNCCISSLAEVDETYLTPLISSTSHVESNKNFFVQLIKKIIK